MSRDPVSRWTIGTLLETAASYLRDKGSSSPRLDAELLLAETLGLERLGLYLEFDRPLTAGEVDRFRALVARRAAHEPVAYVLARAHFRHLVLEVDGTVLIPRPETEELVDAALSSLRRRPVWGAVFGEDTERTATSAPLIVDVGVGSGAIALSIAQEANVRLLATDTSAEALAVAARNAAAAGVESLVEFRQVDLLAGVPEASLHLVISNPPYVATRDLATLAPDIREFEPIRALDGGPDGLDIIRRLIPDAARALRPGGSILLEVGDGQAETVAGLARDAGFAVVGIHKDLSQKDRIVEAVAPGATRLTLADLDASHLSALGAALEAGGILGVPTDTVYGVAARWDSRAGVRALFTAKGRSPEQPVAALFSSVDLIREGLPDLDARAARVLDALLPGPFTFVVATTVPRPPLVGTADSLGVRVPDHAPLLELLRALKVPLAATSANPSGAEDAVCLTDVDPSVLAHCSAAFTGPDDAAHPTEPAGLRSASTVVDLRPLSTGGDPVVLREGAVSAAEVMERIAAL